MRFLWLGLLLSTVSSAPGAPSAQEREVRGRTLVSSAKPAVRLVFDESFDYAGGQTILLSPTTRAEQHFYVEADGDGGRIRRLYWVQFEGRVGGNTRPYDYSSDPVLEVAGESFHTNYRFYPPSGFSGPQGSDGDQARRLLEAEGYRLGPDLARLRLVWLLGDPPLDELMVIYVEDLEAEGLTVAELEDDDRRWEVLKEDLTRRALDSMQVLPGER